MTLSAINFKANSRAIAAFLFVVAVLALSLPSRAQDISSLTGTVTDATGAVVVGAKVTLVDTKSNTTYEAATSKTGAYTIPSVRPGPGYKLTIASKGFKTVQIDEIAIAVGSTRTQNVKLSAGDSASVEVTASDRVALNTTDASIGNNLDIELLHDLPVQSRTNPTALFTLQPGVAAGSVTGARGDQNTITVDGLDVNDIASGQNFAIIGNAPVDSLEEFRGTVAGDLSSNGPGGGGQFQLVTKSGTNTFHGDLNEYHRDNTTEANSWFNDNNAVAKPKLIQNQFGGALGGPILKNKLFFFFDFNDSRIIESASQDVTVPLDTFRNGNLGYILAAPSSGTGTCSFTSRANTTPQCIGYLTPAQVKALDPAGIGNNPAIFAFFNARYPHANDVVTSGDGINTGGYRFTTPTPIFAYNYVSRVDYNINPSMKAFVRFTIAREDATQQPIHLPSDPISNPFTDRSYGYEIGHTWTFGANKVNDLILGNTITKYNFATTYNPTGTTVLDLGAGTNFFLGDPYNGQSSQKRRVPIPVVRDDFSWQRGSHNLTMGGTFKFIKTNSQLVNDFNFVGVGLGGELNSLTPNMRPTTISGGSTAPYDNAFALALGREASVFSEYNLTAAGKNVPQGTGEIRAYRFYETELYISDSWKVTSDLTLTYGLRYQFYSVPFETHGEESIQNFTLNNYMTDRQLQSAAGQQGDGVVPFVTYTLGGKANHAAPSYAPSYKDFAPRLAFAYNPKWHKSTVLNGSVGIIYDRTGINAINFYQDQSSYLFQNSASTSYGTAGTATLAVQQDPRVGTNLSFTNPNTPPSFVNPLTPYVYQGQPYGLADNELFNYVIDPFLKDPYSIAINAGIQQVLPYRMNLHVNYAGRLGRRLLGQADASQLIDFPDTISGQLMGTAFGNITKQVRAGSNPAALPAQAWFENVVAPGVGQYYGYANNTSFLANNFSSYVLNGDMADFIQALASYGLINSNVGMASQFAANTFITNKGFSAYNGLLVSLSKQQSHGLKFDINYTWSHSIDNTSLVANASAGSTGIGFICDIERPRECRGNSDFDIAQVLNADFVYDLPFGHHRAFLASTPTWVDEIVGGWAFSGIPKWQSGIAFTTVSNAFVAGYASNAPSIFNGHTGDLKAHIHKIAAGQPNAGAVSLFNNNTTTNADFSGPVGFQVGSRNNLRGPGITQFDAGLAKTFPIAREYNLKFRADAFNVLNHPTFGTAASDITQASFGIVGGTTTGARVAQFSLRLEF